MLIEVMTAGHLSAKLVVRDEVNDTEAWYDYDTRVNDHEPAEGTIHVFNSETGLYEKCENLAEARAKFEEHAQRLTYVISDETEYLRAKRDELELQNKHLRNLTPFVIGPVVKP